MDKIKELIEKKGKQLYERDVKCIPIKHPIEWEKLPEITRDGYYSQAKELLNDPDLALIDREKQKLDCRFLAPGECMVDERKMEINCPLLNKSYKPVIPLAEAIKEIK